MGQITVATTTNSIITFSPVSPVGEPAITIQGFSDSYMIHLEEITIAESKIGMDGTRQLASIPAQNSGSFSIWSNQDWYWQQLQPLLTASRLTGVPVYGTLSVSIPAMGKRYSYTNVLITTGFNGVQMEKEALPIEIKWTADDVLIVTQYN